jgi:hypothetical protein
MYVNKHCVFYCSKSKTIHGGTPVQTIMYINITKGLCTLITHLDYFLVLLYLESRRCRYRSIIFVCFYLYVSVINLIDYSDIDKIDDEVRFELNQHA